MNLTEFERRAKIVAPYFNRTLKYNKDILPPPFTVEFFGPPSAGKTTVIHQLDKFLRIQGFRCFTPQEGAEAVRYIARDTPMYNIATGIYAYNLLIQLSESHQYDFVLFDRCIFDAYSWMKFWHKKGKLEKNTMTMIQKSFLECASRIDLAIMIFCDPIMAMERETKNELTRQLGSTTQPDIIKFLIECNKKSCEELCQHFPQLTTIETTALSEKEMVQKITLLVLDALEAKIINRK